MRLKAAATALRAASGTALDESVWTGRPTPEKELSRETFATAWAEGQAMTVDEAVAYALEA